MEYCGNNRGSSLHLWGYRRGTWWHHKEGLTKGCPVTGCRTGSSYLYTYLLSWFEAAQFSPPYWAAFPFKRNVELAVVWTKSRTNPASYFGAKYEGSPPLIPLPVPSFWQFFASSGRLLLKLQDCQATSHSNAGNPESTTRNGPAGSL